MEKEEMIYICISAQEKADFKLVAELQKRGMSDLIREWIRTQLEKHARYIADQHVTEEARKEFRIWAEQERQKEQATKI